MKRLARRRRLLVLCLVLAGALLGVRQFLVWGGATGAVAGALEARLGGRVTLDSSRVPLVGRSSLRGLRLYEPGQDEPVLEARRVVADLAALGYLFGRRLPNRLEVRDAHLRLRFDADGELLTHLDTTAGEGGTLPTVVLRDSRLTIEQEGRPAFTLEGVNLELRPGEAPNLTGRIDDPRWGPLRVAGTVDPRAPALSLTLRHPGLKLDMPMLRALPFVPASLWQQIELDGKEVPLRFTLDIGDRAPRVRYGVEFAGARVRLPQKDRPAFTAAPARGVLEGSEEGFTLKGNIDDPLWGKWTVAAGLVARTGAIDLALDCAGVEVEQSRLEALPYVPKSVWRQVRKIRGRTAASIRVRLSTRQPDVHYRVELQVPGTQVEVSSIGLFAEQAAGRVVVEDDVVLLKEVHGTTGGGQLSLDGELDFRKEPSRLHFRIKGRDLVLRRLPAKWELPSQVEGKLIGEAELTVLVHDGRVVTRGRGAGQIDDVKVLGFPAQPITLHLYDEGGKLRFRTRSAVLNSLLLAMLQPGPGPPAKKQLAWAADELVGQVHDGIAWAAGQAARGASAVLAQVGKLHRTRPTDPATYLDARLALEKVDLAELLRRAGVELPREFALAGKVSLTVVLGIPVNKADDTRAYRFDGSVTAEQLVIAGAEFRNLSAKMKYRDGVLRLEELSGALGNGRFAGTGRAAVFPRGELALDLDLARLPLDLLLRLLPGSGGLVTGSVSGRLGVGVALNDLGNARKWRGRAVLRGEAVEVAGLNLRELWASLSLAGGKLALADLRGEVGRAPLRGEAALSLLDKQPLTGKVSVRGLDLSLLGPLLPESWQSLRPAGRADLTADLAGTLNPVQWAPRGRLEAVSLRVGGVRAESLNLDWRIRGQVLDLQGIQVKLYRGSLTGTASLPLAQKKPIDVNLKVENVDAAALARALGGLPVQVAGRLSGQAKVTMRPEGRGWRGDAVLTSPQLTVQNIPLTEVRGTVKWRGRAGAEYRIDGKVLGGNFSAEGSYPPPPRRSVGRYDGQVELRRVLLGKLVEALELGERFRQLDGVLSLRLPFRFDGPAGRPVGEGRIEVRDLRWGDSELAENVLGSLRVGSDGVFLRDGTSYLAGGLLRFQGAYRFSDPERSWFSLTLNQADLARLAAFDPDLKDRFSGAVDVMLRGTLGRQWLGGGSVVVTRGKVLGIEVSEWRVPLDFHFAPRRRRLEVAIRESAARLGGGRALLTASLLWGATMRLEGNVRFLDASLRSLAGLTGDVSSYASGRVTGRVDFAGSEMRSLNDLTASVQAKLRDAQALQMPVLNVLTPFILPGQSATTFHTGELKGRLGGGVFHIAALSLEAPVATVMIQGNVSLAGRLDLGVVARTTQLGGVNPVLVRLLLARLPVLSPAPVGLLLEATNLFANRVIHLQVTGTLRHPVAQVKPLQLLSDEAVRFFLSRALGAVPGLP